MLVVWRPHSSRIIGGTIRFDPFNFHSFTITLGDQHFTILFTCPPNPIHPTLKKQCRLLGIHRQRNFNLKDHYMTYDEDK
jgi:hypothetical protein